MRSQANKTRQLWLPLLIIIGMVMAVSWIIAGDVILNNLRGNDQGVAIQNPGTSTPSPSNTISPSATRTKAAFTSAAILIDTPTPTPPASATRTEAIFTQESTLTPNCTYTIHFWRVYSEVWLIESIDLDSRSYSKEQAIAILNIEDPNLATTRLLQQYIIALLNTLKGADPSGIERTIERASEWLILHPPEIQLTQAESLEGERLADELQDFNDGVTGPGRCIEEPFTPTPGATPTPLNYTPPTPQETSSTLTPEETSPTPTSEVTTLTPTQEITSTQPAATAPGATFPAPTRTPTKKPDNEKPKPTSQPTQPPPPPPTDAPEPTPKPPPSTPVVPPTPPPPPPPPTPEG